MASIVHERAGRPTTLAFRPRGGIDELLRSQVLKLLPELRRLRVVEAWQPGGPISLATVEDMVIFWIWKTWLKDVENLVLALCVLCVLPFFFCFA